MEKACSQIITLVFLFPTFRLIVVSLTEIYSVLICISFKQKEEGKKHLQLNINKLIPL